MTLGPRYRTWKEYESPIHEIRVERGLTIAELSKKSGVAISSITALANGSVAPVYVSKKEAIGRLKPEAERLAKALGVEPGELFPRYVCTLQASELTDDQLQDLTSSEYSRVKAKGNGLAEMDVLGALASLPDKERQVIEGRYLWGMTLAEVGVELGCSRQWVEVVEKEALERLRTRCMYGTHNRKG